MLLIYSEKSSPRLQYVLDFIFSDILAVAYEHTTDIEQYKNFEGSKLNYSLQRIDEREFFVSSSLFIYESDLSAQIIEVIDFEGTKALFPACRDEVTEPSRSVDFPFDIFSAVFYMLSRFEEYQPFIKDIHGRFEPRESIAFKHGFLGKPVVNLWIKGFIEKINKKLSFNLPTIARKYRFINTIDIDLAYSYQNKGVYRNFFGYLRSLKNAQLSEISERTRVLTGFKKDPFDTYDSILDIHQKNNLNTIFFIHVGDYGIYDKNIPFKNSKFRDLVRHLSDYAEIGIHPSYESSTKSEKLQIEIERLSEIIKKDITKSRQHFLRLTFPKTYRNLIDNKIREDYSLGYASETGFRAGTCTPFKFFDLDMNQKTSLIIRPFSIMEGTLKDYQNKNTREAIQCITRQIEEVKSVNGEFISLWHNESLSNAGRWNGWLEVYENMISSVLQ